MVLVWILTLRPRAKLNKAQTSACPSAVYNSRKGLYHRQGGRCSNPEDRAVQWWYKSAKQALKWRKRILHVPVCTWAGELEVGHSRASRQISVLLRISVHSPLDYAR